MTSHPEAALVVGCVCEPGVLEAEELPHRAAQILDWADVVALASANRVTNLVLRAARSNALSLPLEIEQELADSAAQSVAANMVVDLDLKRALSALGETSVRVVVLKGPGLARAVYGEPSLRPYDDIDLAVDASDHDRVTLALVRAGFAEIPTSAEATATSRDFVSTQTRTLIELHGDLLQIGLPPKCDAERWRRTLPIPGLQGAEMLGLEDQIVQLSIHAHKHGFNRLIWLKDLDMVVRAGGTRLDWELVASVSQQEELQASVWLALDLVRTLFGTAVPLALLQSLKPAAPTRLLYRILWPPDAVQALRGRMRRRAVQLNESESWRGIAPSTVFMGRRLERLHLLARHLTGAVRSRWHGQIGRPTSA